ncbi:MAG: hypothetical protein ABI665_11260 [Vicinamibacterales bacterium]
MTRPGLSIPAVAVAALLASASACAPRPAPGFHAARTPDGKPDISGIWQANNTANWNLEPHEARQGPMFALGAAFSIPPGLGVVEGGEIPYQAAALEKRKTNAENWLTLDPEIKCYMPGIPRATYLPYPFQIVQSTDSVVMTYEFASASRIVRFDTKEKSPAPAWMGWSIGRYDGDSLVVDVTDQVEDTWFDRSGNYHSDGLRVTERYTPIDANTLQYEATMDDATVYSKPWRISMPLYRRRDPNMQLMEYKCVPFAEELLYGKFRKKPTAAP